MDPPAASESPAHADVAPRFVDTQSSAPEQAAEPDDRASPKDWGIASSLEQARDWRPVLAIRAAVPFNDTLFAPESTAFIHAYSDCCPGAGVQVKCPRDARIVVDLLDASGQPVPLDKPGARRDRTPSSADLFSPRLHHDFFVRIRNEAAQATICDVLVSAFVYGP